MNQQKKNMELNDAQLESVSGGVELDAIRVTDLIEAKPQDIEDENAWKRTSGPWIGWYYQPCTNCGEITVFKETLEENGNKMKVLRCFQCGHMVYV